MGKEDQASRATLQVAGGQRPAREDFEPAPEPGNWGPSPNIGRLQSAARLGYAVLFSLSIEVGRALAWWRWSFTQPMLEHEEYTPHPAYQNWNVLPAHVAMGYAKEVGAVDVVESARLFLRANAAVLGLVAGTGPGRKILDYGVVGKTRHLVGDGKLVGSVPFCMPAGKRGFVRHRRRVLGRVILGKFLGLDANGGGYLLAVASGRAAPRRGQNGWAADFFAAALRRWPWMRPFGLTAEESATLRAFGSNPTDLLLARELVSWLNARPELLPSLSFEIGRHADGSVWMLVRKAGSSSTATLAIVVWHADGRCEWASWDAGGRDSGGEDDDVTRGRAWEEEHDLVCVSETNGLPEVRVAKPAAPIVYRIEIAPSGAGVFEVDAPPAPGPLPGPTPSPAPSPKPEDKPSLGDQLKELWARLKALLKR